MPHISISGPPASRLSALLPDARGGYSGHNRSPYQETGKNGQVPDISLIAGYLALVELFTQTTWITGNPVICSGLVPCRCPDPAVTCRGLCSRTRSMSSPSPGTRCLPVSSCTSRTGNSAVRKEKIKPKRRKPGDRSSRSINRSYFVLIVMIFAITAALMLFGRGWGTPALSILLLAVFCGVFYIFGRMHLFRGSRRLGTHLHLVLHPDVSDHAAPQQPATRFPVIFRPDQRPHPNLVAPLAIFAINIVRGNRAPLMYMFFGFPVKGDRIQESWGFVMEDFEIKKGAVTRKFIGFTDSLRRMFSGVGRNTQKTCGSTRRTSPKNSPSIRVRGRSGSPMPCPSSSP